MERNKRGTLVKGRFNRYEGGILVKYKRGDVVALTEEEAIKHRFNFKMMGDAAPQPQMRHVVPAVLTPASAPGISTKAVGKLQDKDKDE